MNGYRVWGVWVVLIGLLAASGSQAADGKNGKALHDELCAPCHAKRFEGDANKIYDPAIRKKKTLDELRSQVSFCNQQISAGLWPDQEEDLVDYLNDAFYKFK